jgi:hypothetical protein
MVDAVDDDERQQILERAHDLLAAAATQRGLAERRSQSADSLHRDEAPPSRWQRGVERRQREAEAVVPEVVYKRFENGLGAEPAASADANWDALVQRRIEAFFLDVVAPQINERTAEADEIFGAVHKCIIGLEQRIDDLKSEIAELKKGRENAAS